MCGEHPTITEYVDYVEFCNAPAVVRRMTRVRIPPTLRADVGGARELEADGETVGDVIENLVEQLPAAAGAALRERELGSFVNVYLGGEDVRTLDGLDTPVRQRRDRDPPAGDGRWDLRLEQPARPSSLDLIGSTPLVELQRLSP